MKEMKKEMSSICFIIPPNPILESPLMQVPLGVLYLGAVLEKAGFKVFISDMRAEQQINTTLIPTGYDCYAVSATTGEYHYAKELANLLAKKEHQAFSIIGGPHATHKPRETLSDTKYDYAVMGEGEKTIVEILELMDPDAVNGLAWRLPPSYRDTNNPDGIRINPPQSLIEDLDSIPFPARHLLTYDHIFTSNLYYGERYGRGEVGTVLMTERGCPYRCAYCANWDRKLRLRSVENVVAEIKECIEVYRCSRFKIIDDEFGMPQRRAWKLCEALEPLDIHFRAQTRVDQVTPDLLKAFKKAGCDEIGFGIETPDENILSCVDKKATLQQAKNAVKWAKEAGIRVKTLFMVCLPKETWESCEKLKNFVAEVKPDRWTLSTFIPYPGCDVEKNPEKYGVKILERDYSKYWLYQEDSIIETDVATREELNQHRVELFKWLLNYDKRKEATKHNL